MPHPRDPHAFDTVSDAFANRADDCYQPLRGLTAAAHWIVVGVSIAFLGFALVAGAMALGG